MGGMNNSQQVPLDQFTLATLPNPSTLPEGYRVRVVDTCLDRVWFVKAGLWAPDVFYSTTIPTPEQISGVEVVLCSVRVPDNMLCVGRTVTVGAMLMKKSGSVETMTYKAHLGTLGSLFDPVLGTPSVYTGTAANKLFGASGCFCHRIKSDVLAEYVLNSSSIYNPPADTVIDSVSAGGLWLTIGAFSSGGTEAFSCLRASFLCID